MMKRPAIAMQPQEPSRSFVLNTIASMTGPNSGGKTKVIKQLVKAGVKAAAAKRSCKKLAEEKAIFASQTKRTLSNGKTTWRAMRVDKEKQLAANMFQC